jgi:sterol desaturase/sphingolipid hydroxylase (fatty acid hydroxylase superfamily)
MNDMTMALAPMRRAQQATPWMVTWLTWPLLFVITIGTFAHAIAFDWNYATVLGALTGGTIIALVTLEFLYPLDNRWRMTWRSFFGRDIKYILSGGISGAATNYFFGIIGLQLSAGHEGPMANWPVWLAAPMTILAFDFFQYWQHRWSHEADTPFKQFLWRTHAPHHLPEQVYVLMHPASHPLNIFFLQGIIKIPLLYLLGPSPDAVFAVTAIMGLQGIISHCNVDLRAGWFNYIFTGAELHRFHHSAEVSEAQNYAVTFSFLDILFGTFVYEPDHLPARIGVFGSYPRSSQFWRVMLMPFRQP